VARLHESEPTYPWTIDDQVSRLKLRIITKQWTGMDNTYVLINFIKP
jgi:hypothetical protein